MFKNIWTALDAFPTSVGSQFCRKTQKVKPACRQAAGWAGAGFLWKHSVLKWPHGMLCISRYLTSACALYWGSQKGEMQEDRWQTGEHLCRCQESYLVNLAQSSLPEVRQTCFLPYDASLRNTNCKDFLCSHKKGKETAGKCFTDGKTLGISLKRGPPMQMAHYFNIWIFILLKHLFFPPGFI